MHHLRILCTVLVVATALGFKAASAADAAAQCQASDPYRNGEETYKICDQAIAEAKQDDLSKAMSLAQRGEAYYWVYHFREAISDFDAALVISPELNETRMQRGWARIQIGDYDGAYGDFTEAMERDPKSGRAVFALAFLQRNESVARKAYEQALVLAPDYYLAHGNIAQIDGRSEQTRHKALERYDYLIGLGETKLNAVRFFGFGGMYQTKNYYDNTLFNRAILLFDMGQYKEALNDFEKLQILSETEPMPYIKHAEALVALKDYNAVGAVAETALNICVKSRYQSLCGRAVEATVKADINLGNFDDVIKRARNVENSQFDPYSRALISIAVAQAYKSTGDRDMARKAFLRAGQLQPDVLAKIANPMTDLGYYEGYWDGKLDDRFLNGLEACLLDAKCVANL